MDKKFRTVLTVEKLFWKLHEVMLRNKKQNMRIRRSKWTQSHDCPKEKENKI